MKYAVGFVFGAVIAVSLSAWAGDIPWPRAGLDDAPAIFMFAGGKDSDGNGHQLRMTADGRVLAKCTEDRP